MAFLDIKKVKKFSKSGQIFHRYSTIIFFIQVNDCEGDFTYIFHEHCLFLTDHPRVQTYTTIFQVIHKTYTLLLLDN